MNTKQLLKEAWEAGVKSVDQNKDRDSRLERGVKQIEQEYNFENWLAEKQITMLNRESKFEQSSKIISEIANSYSELAKLNKTQIGSAQIFSAMEDYLVKLTK